MLNQMPSAAELPTILVATPNWVCWRRETRNEKETKVPYRVGGELASVTDPRTWSTFAAVRKAAAAGGFDGIGFVLTEELGLVGLDLDKCIPPGADPHSGADGMEEWAFNVIRRFATYTEVSPSGTGLRLWLKGSLPPGRRRSGQFEIYSSGRYLTVTGNRLQGAPMCIAEGGEALAQLHAEMFPEKEKKPARAAVQQSEMMTDDAILDLAFRAQNGGDVKRLWEGDLSQHENDHSRADAALCSHLAFYAGPGGNETVDKLFRRSALMREKWDQKRRADGTTYGQMTIEKIYADMTEFYEGSDVADLEKVRQNARNVGDTANVGRNVGDGSSALNGQKSGVRTVSRSQKAAETALEWDETAKCWNVGGFWEFENSPIGLEIAQQVPFPQDALPERLLAYVSEVAKVVQVPIEMPAMLSLAVLAAAVSRRWEIRIGHTHEEPTCLYIAVAAEPGARKSQALNAVKFPLQQYEAELLRLHRDTKFDTEQLSAEAVDKAADLAKLISREKDEAKRKLLRDELKALKTQEPKVSPDPKMLVDDVTQERLAQLMIEQNGCMAMMSDEGGIFDILAGRYSEGINLDLFLKAHDAGQFRIDRLNRPSEYIERACLSIGLCVQPDIIHRALGTRKEFKGRGLLGRFLFAIPPDLRGTRMYDPAAPGIDKELRHEYSQMIRTLLRYPSADPMQPTAMHTLKIDPEALKVHAQLMNDIEKRQGVDRDLRQFADWASKLAGKVARIAAIFHCVQLYEQRPEADVIDTQTILAAWRVGAWLIDHCKRAYGLAQDNEVSLLAGKMLDWLRSKRMRSFGFRDITQQFHKEGDREMREKALHLLGDLGWIKGPNRFLNPKTRREIELYGCAPAVYEENP